MLFGQMKKCVVMYHENLLGFFFDPPTFILSHLLGPPINVLHLLSVRESNSPARMYLVE